MTEAELNTALMGADLSGWILLGIFGWRKDVFFRNFVQHVTTSPGDKPEKVTFYIFNISSIKTTSCKLFSKNSVRRTDSTGDLKEKPFVVILKPFGC